MKKGVLFALAVILVFFIGAAIGRFITEQESVIQCTKEEQDVEIEIENVKVKTYNNKLYYIKTGKYTGDYDYQEIDLDQYADPARLVEFNLSKRMTYYEYESFMKKWNLRITYTDRYQDYMVLGHINTPAELINVTKDGNIENIYLWENKIDLIEGVKAYLLVIPISRQVSNCNIIMTYHPEEFERIKNPIIPAEDPSLDKPVLYIYPTVNTNVSVRLAKSELITTSYPKYNNGWEVLASPNGNLKDIKTNKNYYALYWEGKNYNAQVKEDGFVIKGSDTISFLEEKLSILGLTEKEINEFMMYWLPKLEHNNYNYIRFSTDEEINNYMPLEITPKPDTIIRVAMTYKPLDNYIIVNEQKLVPKTRNGYTVVEWGGSLINN